MDVERAGAELCTGTRLSRSYESLTCERVGALHEHLQQRAWWPRALGFARDDELVHLTAEIAEIMPISHKFAKEKALFQRASVQPAAPSYSLPSATCSPGLLEDWVQLPAPRRSGRIALVCNPHALADSHNVFRAEH